MMILDSGLLFWSTLYILMLWGAENDGHKMTDH